MGLPIFTVDSENDHVVWIQPAEQATFDIEDRIDVETYLELQGFQTEGTSDRTPVAKEHRIYGQTLANSIEKFGKALLALNWLSTKAEGNLTSPPIEAHISSHEPFQELMSQLQKIGLLAISGNRLDFASEEAREYVGGGWLEEHVYSELRSLCGKKGIQDLVRGIHFYKHVNGQTIRNELDIALLADNRLYFIECKSSKMGNTGEGFKKQNQFLYKLHSLKHSLGGRDAQAMLLSYKAIGNRQQERARAMGVEICHGHGVRDIKRTVVEWLVEK
jgi:hypothetical protein